MRDRKNRAPEFASRNVSNDTQCESTLTRLKEENGRVAGQNQNMRQKLAARGNGTELPPCWTTSDGKIKYSFNVALSDDGVMIQDNPPDTEAESRVLEGIILGQILDGHAYLITTNNAYDWAREHKCGIFVRVVDNTGQAEKTLYKLRLRNVQAHFYTAEPLKAGTLTDGTR
jgi:hypothetical protein